MLPDFTDLTGNGGDAVSDACKTETLPRPLPSIETREGMLEILERAAKGQTDVLPMVRKLFDRDREADGYLAETYGNSFVHARDAMIKLGAGSNLAVQEALRRKIADVRDDLAGPNPTPLERTL